MPVQPMASQSVWQQGKAHRDGCVESARIAAAEVVDHRHLDLILRGGRRVRLILHNDCPQLTFYGGFYYSQTQSGMICAGRDRVIGRAGGVCRVRALAELKERPAPAKRSTAKPR